MPFKCQGTGATAVMPHMSETGPTQSPRAVETRQVETTRLQLSLGCTGLHSMDYSEPRKFSLTSGFKQL